MNAKLCKRLRAEALRLTVGCPPRMVVWTGRPQASQAFNDHRSSRGIYRLLKDRARASVTFEAVQASREHSAALIKLSARRKRRRRAAARGR